jgi:hypothetical protein
LSDDQQPQGGSHGLASSFRCLHAFCTHRVRRDSDCAGCRSPQELTRLEDAWAAAIVKKDGAAVIGVFNAVVKTAGGTETRRWAWTDTWVKQADGQWLCIASQAARLSK